MKFRTLLSWAVDLRLSRGDHEIRILKITGYEAKIGVSLNAIYAALKTAATWILGWPYRLAGLLGTRRLTL
jgi:hypothetical protein